MRNPDTYRRVLALALIALTSPAVADNSANPSVPFATPFSSGWIECRDSSLWLGLDTSRCDDHGGPKGGHSPGGGTVTMSTNGEFVQGTGSDAASWTVIQGASSMVEPPPKRCNQGWVLISVATSITGPEVKKCAPAGALVDPQ